MQLIYAFNGTGKTRLSRVMKDLIAPTPEEGEDREPSREKVLYYNAFTEDLFYWDNDFWGDGVPMLMIQPNSFTDWILGEQGRGNAIIENFQRYTNKNLTPIFLEVDGQKAGEKTYPSVSFNITTGDDEATTGIKVSKSEESSFIWCVFYTLIEEVISTLNSREAEGQDATQFEYLEYVFIDDPVTSLDENHLIVLAVDLAKLIKTAPRELKFVITTHSPLFYNVLHNELGLKKQDKKEGCYLLERLDDGTFNLNVKYGGANTNFSYHLHLKKVLKEAIAENRVERYHFILLRNLYEKTAGVLGYRQWADLLDTALGDKEAYVRAINTFSHSSLSNEQVRDPTPPERNTVKLLFENLMNNYGYWQQDE